MFQNQVQRHLRQARRLLAVVQDRAEVELPEVTAPTAYYAMRHAAMALLIAHGAASPRTDRGVITCLGQLAREQAWKAEADIGLLGRALTRRLIADHDALDVLAIEHARSARDEAIAFVSFCEQKMASV